MNYIKYQCDLIKMYDKDKRIKIRWDYTDIDRKKLIMTIDGFVACIIPLESFYLSDQFKNASARWTGFHQLISGLDQYEDANEWKIMQEGKKQLFKLTANERFAWIDSKKLKYFNHENMNLKIKDKISPVMVYENGTLVGFVMPVRRNEEGK